MRLSFTEREIVLLKKQGIAFHQGEYTEDDAFSLLDDVHDAEIFYVQNEDRESDRLAGEYARLADKIQNAIPED